MANKTITLVDNGDERYLIKADFTTLGRRYDNESEELTVIFPEFEREAEHACTMVVTHDNQNVDRILVTDNTPVAITSRLSQYTSVTIGFVFTDSNGYIKGSEKKQFPFLPAQSPEDFVPVDPEIEDDLLFIIANALTKLGLSGNTLQGKNKAETVTTSVDLTAFKNTNIKFNDQVVEEVDANDFAAGIKMSLDTTNYKLTVNLVDGNDVVLSTQTVDLPSENAIVDASYDSITKTITFVLQSGNTFEVDVSSIVSGLVNDTRTIAGLRLNADISATDLRTALNVEDGASSFNEDNIIAGNNVTITKSGKNVTISSTGGGGGASSFDQLSGSPYDNTNLANALNSKVDKTTTIAGVDLQDDITKPELAAALGISPDLNIINGDVLDSVKQKGENIAKGVQSASFGYSNKISTNSADLSGFDTSNVDEDVNHAFIGGGQSNAAVWRNSATIGGKGLQTRWRDQTVVGRDNSLVPALFVVGNGSDLVLQSTKPDYAVALAGNYWYNSNNRYLPINTDNVPTSNDYDAIAFVYLQTGTITKSNAFEVYEDGSIKSPALTVNNEYDNVQAGIANSSNNTNDGNLATIISSDDCSIGEGNGREVIIASKTSSTNANDSAVIAARNGKVTKTETAVIGGQYNEAKLKESVIAGGHGNEITSTSNDSGYHFIGGGQANKCQMTGDDKGGVVLGGSTNIVRKGNSGIVAGLGNTVTGAYSGILGGDNNSITANDGAIIGGTQNAVSFDRGVALGGRNLQTGRTYQVVAGKYNVGKNNTLFEIGYGEKNANSNVFEVTTGGIVRASGTPVDGIDLTPKAYVDTAISNAQTNLYKIQGSETVANLNSATKSATMNGYVYDISVGGNLTNNDSSTVTAIAGDNVVFLWGNGSWKWDKLSGEFDLSGYVQKSTTIAGVDLQDNITAGELRTGLNVADGANVTSKTGSAAPTTSTIADFVGQLYIDSTNNKTYECSAITEDTSTTPSTFTYTWEQLIRATDKASSANFGVVRNQYEGISGIGIYQGDIYAMGASSAGIEARSGQFGSGYGAIVPNNLNNAVKAALSDNNHLTMTSAEQAVAKEVLGITTIKTTMDATATVNTEYYLGSQSTVNITLPSTATAGDKITVDFTSGATATTLTITGNNVAGDTSFTPEANKLIEMNFKYDGTYWKLLVSSVDVPTGV